MVTTACFVAGSGLGEHEPRDHSVSHKRSSLTDLSAGNNDGLLAGKNGAWMGENGKTIGEARKSRTKYPLTRKSFDSFVETLSRELARGAGEITVYYCVLMECLLCVVMHSRKLHKLESQHLFGVQLYVFLFSTC